MLNQLEEIEQAALVALDEVEDEQAMEQWRVANLGRSSPLMAVFDQMRDLPKDERPAIGRRSNEVKQKLEKKHSEKADLINQLALQKSLETERLDVTMPGRPVSLGRLHDQFH
jgi:phenylalanyl-tRNA synthetase alpha chain